MECYQLLLNCGLDIQDDSLSCITAVDHIFILLAQLNCIRLEKAYKIFEFINSLQYSMKFKNIVLCEYRIGDVPFGHGVF